MIQRFEFLELDLKGAFKIQPFYAIDERGGAELIISEKDNN